RARDAHHVAEAGEEHARLAGDGDAVVDPAHGNDAHRAAWTVDELDVGGQQVVDAVLVDRVRVPGAHFHELVVATGLDQGENLAGQRPAELRIAEFFDVLHAASAFVMLAAGPVASALFSSGARFAIAVPAWTRIRSPGSTGSIRATSTVCR